MLWGVKAKTSIVERGNFVCPRCKRKRNYKRKQSRYYFYAFFIPWYDTDGFNLIDVIQCDSCQMHFDQSLLHQLAEVKKGHKGEKYQVSRIKKAQ